MNAAAAASSSSSTSVDEPSNKRLRRDGQLDDDVERLRGTHSNNDGSISDQPPHPHANNGNKTSNNNSKNLDNNNDNNNDDVDLLEPFETFGWTPNPTISEDENFMDLILLLTRNSQLKDGSMACLLVQKQLETPTLTPSQEESCQRRPYVDRIISVANNQALYTKNRSDVHAEIVAIGQAARKGRSTENATAYITMPPCKNCFAALVSAGVTRIYTQYDNPNTQSRCVDPASRHTGRRIVMESLGKEHSLPAARARVAEIVQTHQAKKKQQQQEQEQVPEQKEAGGSNTVG